MDHYEFHIVLLFVRWFVVSQNKNVYLFSKTQKLPIQQKAKRRTVQREFNLLDEINTNTDIIEKRSNK